MTQINVKAHTRKGKKVAAHTRKYKYGKLQGGTSGHTYKHNGKEYELHVAAKGSQQADLEKLRSRKPGATINDLSNHYLEKSNHHHQKAMSHPANSSQRKRHMSLSGKFDKKYRSSLT